MAFKTLTVLEKETTTPLEISVTPRRLATPYYQLDASLKIEDTLEITDYFYTETEINNFNFLKCVSIGATMYWHSGTLDVSGLNITNLGSLTDVSLSTLTDKNAIQYDTSILKWKNVGTLNADLYYQSILSQATKTGTSAGTPGQWSYDSSYLYVCTSTNIWKRATLSSF